MLAFIIFLSLNRTSILGRHKVAQSEYYISLVDFQIYGLGYFPRSSLYVYVHVVNDSGL